MADAETEGSGGSPQSQPDAAVLDPVAAGRALEEVLRARFAPELRQLSPGWTLVSGKKWQVDVSEVTGIPSNVLGAILVGRCRDQHINLTPEHEKRFVESMQSQCASLWFSFSDVAAGPECARAIAVALLLNPRFTSLSLASNLLGDSGAGILADMLAQHESLVHLDLSANGVQQSGVNSILEALLVNRSLTYLDISSKTHGVRNRADRKNSEVLEQVLSANPVLSKLCLGGVCLGADGLVGVARGLTLNSTLLSLDLSSNDIGTRGAVLIAEVLADCGLEELNLSDNKIGDEGLAALGVKLGSLPSTLEAALDSTVWGSLAEDIHVASARYFEAARLAPRALREVPWETQVSDMGPARDKASRHAAAVVADVLAGVRAATVRVPSLRTLVLAGNGSGASSGAAAPGLACIQDALRANSTLEKLVLDGCDHKTVDPLMVALPVNSALKSLSLGNCRLVPTRIVDLCKALSFNSTLESLSLRSNPVGEEGAVALGALLATGAGPLRALNLSSCHLTNEEGLDIARGLECNARLETLHLRNNFLREEAACAIVDAVRANTTLTQLTLELNAVDIRHIEEVKRLLERNAQARKGTLADAYSKRIDELLVCKKEVDILAHTLDRNKTTKRQARVKQAAVTQDLKDTRERERLKQRELEAAIEDVDMQRKQVDQELAATKDGLRAVVQDGEYEASQLRVSMESVEYRIKQIERQMKQTTKQLEQFEERAGAELKQLGAELEQAERSRSSAATLASAAQRNLDSFTTALKSIEGDIAGGANPRQRRVEVPKPKKSAKPDPKGDAASTFRLRGATPSRPRSARAAGGRPRSAGSKGRSAAAQTH